MSTKAEIIQKDAAYVTPSYGRLPLAAVQAHGAVVTDADGKEYLDLTSGIGVLSLGHTDEAWVAAVQKQAATLAHVSNYYYTEPYVSAAEKLCKLSGLRRVFFGNSGAEANEGAIKTARKYSWDKYQNKSRTVIVTLENSFHGRTVTTLAATGQEVFHQNFFPFTEGFRYVPANDIAALEAALGGDVCAFLFEPVQGEGGVIPLTAEYAQAAERLCRERDILLMCDEVQSGIGRCGAPFAFQLLGVAPDVVTAAKGLGGGLPIGAVLAGERVASVLGAGQHGSTFGGNPIACAGANVVLDRLAEPAFCQDVVRKGEKIRAAVEAAKLPAVAEVRGRGLLVGIALKPEYRAKHALLTAFENGLLVLTAGGNVVRLLPPLTISDAELDRALALLLRTLSQLRPEA